MHPIKRISAVILFLILLFVVFQVSGLREHFNLMYLRQLIAANKFSGLIVFILLFSLGNLIQIPGWLFLAAAVLTFGKAWGAAATYTAAVVSCIFTFLVIRFIGGDALRQVKNKIAVRIFANLDSHPIISIIALRIVFQTVPALNYALAMSGVKFRKYLIGTMLGLPLPIILYCLFFAYLGRLFKVL